MFERFTERARTVVVLAQEAARDRGDASIGTEHVLLAMFAVPDNLGAMVLEAFSVRKEDVEAAIATRRAQVRRPDADALASLGIDLDEVRRRVEAAFGPGALDRAATPERRWIGGHMPFTKESKKALELALREALRLRHNYIGCEHLLLGLLHGDGLAHDVLTDGGVRLDVARVIVEELVRGRRAG